MQTKEVIITSMKNPEKMKVHQEQLVDELILVEYEFSTLKHGRRGFQAKELKMQRETYDLEIFGKFEGAEMNRAQDLSWRSDSPSGDY